MQVASCKGRSSSISMAPPKYKADLVVYLVLFCLYTIAVSADVKVHKIRQQSQDWLNHGGDLFNRRYAYKESKISPETAPKLHLKWKFYAGNDITATPAIYDGTLYFPSWNGYIYAVKESDGSLLWKKNLQRLTGLNAIGLINNVNWTVSRATPTVAGDLLVVGIYGPAVVIAVKRTSGKLVWLTRLDNHPAGVITVSGTYYKGNFYVGTSSLEEDLTIEQCCTFVGSMSKLDIRSGAILWQTYTLPDNHGKKGEYAGGSIWGSSPSIDIHRNHVYIATGNLYSTPLRIRQCQEKENNQTVPTHPDECVEPDNHSDSIMAFDLDSGKIKWYRQLGGYDVWFAACSNLSTPNCPPGPNPDADFSEAPIMLSIQVNGTKRDIVVAVQKGGFAWALDRDDGKLIWSKEAPGGGVWGAATDEERVYTNFVTSASPSNTTTASSGWAAMDASNGKIVWSTGNPSNANAFGPVSVANGVVFAGSTDRNGSLYAINAKSGEILWSNETGASIYGGVSISDGCIYVGNGYHVAVGVTLNLTGGTSLFAFCV